MKKFIITLALSLLLCSSAAFARKSYSPQSSPDISCPGDRVVWVNTNSGVYHYQGERWFGNTNNGEYACEKEAKREGDRATRNGQ